jgi:hypothetical protein
MSIDASIKCPNCGKEFKLNETLAGPIIEQTRKEYDEKIAAKDMAIEKRESEITSQKARLAAEKANLDSVLEAKLKDAKLKITEEESKRAKELLDVDIKSREKEIQNLKEIAKDREKRLEKAQKTQAGLMRKQRELDDAKRELEVTVEKRVDQSLANIREKAKKEAEENASLKVTERDEKISAMQKRIEDLMRRAEQGSQQSQGEALEIQLETELAAKFPIDVHSPVAKGEFGGDLLQTVVGPGGNECGTILWESKRTKNWSDGWLAKLRNDQRAAKADIAIIISTALPEGITSFDLMDGVWVAHPNYVIPLAILLRQSLIEISSARVSNEGQDTKMQLVYSYLTGPQFRHRIEAIVERFTDMSDDLNRERKAMTRLWAKREKQIGSVVDSTVGMYGDLQGIAGGIMQEIEGLELPLLEEPASEAE